MKRVNKANPCPRCQKTRWCMYDEFRCLCMNDSTGKAFLLKSGETGYWHKLSDSPSDWRPPVRVAEPPKVDGRPLMDKWLSETKSEWIAGHAKQLGIQPSSLMEMRVAWASEHNAWAWPQRNAGGDIQGIRLRTVTGEKWSVTGAGSGIFLPWCTPQRVAWLPEGGTDTAALLSLNLFAIGRPSCSGGTDEINATIKRLGIREAVIISDNDEDKTIGGRTYNPGADGAKRLSERLIIPNCVITLPCKDIREGLSLGITAQMLESLTQNCIWRNP